MKALLRHKILRSIVLLFALFSCSLAAFSDDSNADKARKQWLIGFKKVKEAMDAEAGDDKVNALMLYKESLKVFATVKDKFPDYNPPLITYRIDFSRKKIAMLNRDLSKDVDSLSKGQLLKMVKELHRESSILKKNTVRLLRLKKLNTLALAQARKEAAASGEVGSLNQVSIIQNKKLRDQLKGKDVELKTLQRRVSQLSRKAGIDKELTKLQQSYDFIKGQRTGLLAERDSFKTKMDLVSAQLRETSIENQKLNGQLTAHKADAITIAKLETDLAGKKEDIQGLYKDNAMLQKRTTELRASLKLLKSQLAKADAGSASDDLQNKFNKLMVEKEEVSDLLVAERNVSSKANRELDALQKKNMELRKHLNTKYLNPMAEENKGLTLMATQKKLAKAEALSKRYYTAFKESEKISTDMKKEVVSLKQIAGRITQLEAENKALNQELTSAKQRSVQLQGLEQVVSSGDSNLKVLKGKFDAQVAINASLHDKIRELTRTLLSEQGGSRESSEKKAANSASKSIRRKLTERLVKLATELEESREAKQRLEKKVVELSVGNAKSSLTLNLPTKNSKIGVDDTLRLRALTKMATNAERTKRVQTAIRAYKQILDIDSTNALATKRLGLIFVANSDNESGVFYLKKCLDRGVVDASMYRALGFAYIAQQNYYMAISALTRAVAEFPEDGQVRQYLAVALQTVAWGDASRREYEKAFKLNPQNGTIAFNLAVLLATSENNKDLKEAKVWYKKARALGAEPDPTLEAFFAQ